MNLKPSIFSFLAQQMSMILLLQFAIGCPLLLAQGLSPFECQETEPPFTGTPTPTLCEQFASSDCDVPQTIGAGTAYPKSSLIGPSISGFVCIQGDFLVDEPFSFEHAIVRISPNVKIAIQGSVSPYGSPGSSLAINDSKLFACTDMWEGIQLGILSSIWTGG